MGLGGKTPRGNEQALFASSGHGPAKVPNHLSSHGLLVALALKENREAYQRHTLDAHFV